MMERMKMERDKREEQENYRLERMRREMDEVAVVRREKELNARE